MCNLRGHDRQQAYVIRALIVSAFVPLDIFV
jgi:hypothetical protein